MADILNAVPLVENYTSVSTAVGVEQAWRYMNENYSRFQIATFGSGLVHFVSTMIKPIETCFSFSINLYL